MTLTSVGASHAARLQSRRRTPIDLLGSGDLLFRVIVVAKYCRRVNKPFTVQHADALEHVGETRAKRRARHEAFYAVTRGQFNTLVLVGSIALAAWTQLLATAGTAGGNELTPITRNLLLAASATPLVSPLLFRNPDQEFSFLGRERLASIGYTALILSLVSALADLFSITGVVIATLVVAVILATDVLEARAMATMYE